MSYTITDLNGTRTVRTMSDRCRDAGLIRHPTGQGHWIAPHDWSKDSLPDDLTVVDEALIPIGSDAIPYQYRVSGPYDGCESRSYCRSVKVIGLVC